MDWLGGVALALLVGGALLIPAEGARSGWSSFWVLTGAAGAIVGLVTLAVRELMADSPFIPREFLRSSRYQALVWMSFSVMAANLAPLIGLPILLSTVHRLSPLEVEFVLLPSAILTSIAVIAAGRITDRLGARLPIWTGSPLMLLAVLSLSTYAGASVWVISLFAGILGAGFGLVNTPLAATVSRIVRVQMLASALSINSMLFFLGGSLGTALLIAVVTVREGSASRAFNPLHFGVGTGFSDAFLLLSLPVLAVMALSMALPRSQAQGATPQPQPPIRENWVANCSVPWMPACQEFDHQD